MLALAGGEERSEEAMISCRLKYGVHIWSNHYRKYMVALKKIQGRVRGQSPSLNDMRNRRRHKRGKVGTEKRKKERKKDRKRERNKSILTVRKRI